MAQVAKICRISVDKLCLGSVRFNQYQYVVGKQTRARRITSADSEKSPKGHIIDYIKKQNVE